ncbi:MAG: rRNA maturation RNase YbeY [Clostridia bacterium]|nr:rRNA maturation RNase YbeY [Clostridia bacterium]
MTHRIAVENEQTGVTMPRGYKTLLRRAAAMALEAGGFDRRAEIGVTLVEPEEIRRLNREYRDTDRPTDVLSFPLLEDPFHPGEDDVFRGCVGLGDVIVCPAVLEEQAADFGVTFREETCRMVIHSVLHLLGRDHVEKKEKEAMFALQEKILGELKKETEL